MFDMNNSSEDSAFKGFSLPHLSSSSNNLRWVCLSLQKSHCFQSVTITRLLSKLKQNRERTKPASCFVCQRSLAPIQTHIIKWPTAHDSSLQHQQIWWVYYSTLIRICVCVCMKGSKSALIYYDYENVLSFDNVKDSGNQWNSWLMEGQHKWICGWQTNTEMVCVYVYVFELQGLCDWASAAAVV